MATATVNNGVNVQALLDAREALKGAPGGHEVHVAGVVQMAERHAQQDERPELLRPRAGAAAQDRDVVRRRPSGDLRLGGQGHHADRIRPRRPRELPHGGRRGRRAESRRPAAIGRIEARRQDGHPRHSRHRQRRAERLRRHQGDVQDRCGRAEEGHRGDRRAVAEALGGVRRDRQSR